HGQAAHSGSTPMNRRKDAFLAAAKMSLESYRIAERSSGAGVSPASLESGEITQTRDAQAGRPCHYGGVCTIGSCTTKPGIVTSVVEECRITLDQRHLDGAALARMLQEGKDASEVLAKEGNVRVSWERLWQIAPRPGMEARMGGGDESIR